MQYKIIKIYSQYTEAHLAKNLLEVEGIQSWLDKEISSTLMPFLDPGKSGTKLMVLAQDEKSALEILNSSSQK